MFGNQGVNTLARAARLRAPEMSCAEPPSHPKHILKPQRINRRAFPLFLTQIYRESWPCCSGEHRPTHSCTRTAASLKGIRSSCRFRTLRRMSQWTAYSLEMCSHATSPSSSLPTKLAGLPRSAWLNKADRREEQQILLAHGQCVLEMSGLDKENLD